jgi:ferredoxin
MSADGNVYVNEDCIGCWACVAICDEVFDLNEEGVAYAKGMFTQTSDIDDAIWACPVNAIHYK